MNPARTLADRFRTQRTDRIRVDGNEVVSLFETELPAGAAIVIVVETLRSGTTQGIALRSDQPVGVVASSPVLPDGPQTPAIDTFVDTTVFDMVEFAADADLQDITCIQLWNTWTIDGDEQAWTGNSGMIVEELETPDGAVAQHRVWCSDGLGNPSFDDLVLVVTVTLSEPGD